MYTYTKQEVMEFLGTTTTVNNNLLDGLKRKGFTAKTNGKRGANLRFELDKPMVDPIQQEFGFRPSRPETTRALLKAFHDFGGVLVMSWIEVSVYIKETQGINIAPNNLSTVYVELLNNEKTCPVVRKIVLNEGKPLTEDEKVEFDEYLAELREWNDNMSITFQMALGKFCYQNVKVKEIGAY